MSIPMCRKSVSVTIARSNLVFFFFIYNTLALFLLLQISCSSGNAYTSPRYSGSQIPGVLTLSSCNQVNEYFHADNANSYAGFNLTYNITSGKLYFLTTYDKRVQKTGYTDTW